MLLGLKKNPNSAIVQPSQTMAYRFIDPRPFMPPHAQRVMVLGRLAMFWVVMGMFRSTTMML
jgi:hypothetical protein